MRQTAKTLISLIETVLELPKGTLKQPGRKREIVMGRRIFYFLMRDRYQAKASFSWLGKRFGQDHASAMHGIKKHTEEIGTWPEYRDVFFEIKTIFDRSAEDSRRETKGGVIELLRQRYIERTELEKEIQDLEVLLKVLDSKQLSNLKAVS